MNSTGDRGDPWGTPHDTIRVLDVKGPSFTVWARFSKNDENQGTSESATPATSEAGYSRANMYGETGPSDRFHRTCLPEGFCTMVVLTIVQKSARKHYAGRVRVIAAMMTRR